MRNLDVDAVPGFETDLEKTAQAYDGRIIAGWEELYSRMASAFWERVEPLVPSAGSVLELGCGDGNITGHLARCFGEVCVVDGSLRMLDACRAGTDESPQSKAEMSYVHSTFELYEPTQRFDLIVMAHILEHLDDPVELLRRSKNWLNPGGKLLVLVPNAGSLHRRVAVHMGLLGSPDELNEQDLLLGHRRVYWPETLQADVRSGGWDIEHFGGIMVKPLTNRMIEKDWSAELIEGFLALGDELPDLCAEIYAVADRAAGGAP